MTTEVLAGAEWWNRLYEPLDWENTRNDPVPVISEVYPKQETEAERIDRIWKAVEDYSKF
jgi:hypothetical protein